MNIFVLSENPEECAELHCDKHVVKMILEYAQLLSTAHRVFEGVERTQISPSGRKVKRYMFDDVREHVFFKATHHNHPAAVWVRESDANYKWLYNLYISLMLEYTHRYNKIHSCVKLIDPLEKVPNNLPFGSMTPFAQCMPEQYRCSDAIDAYKQFYIHEKKRFAKYTKRNYPTWL